jgi:hypothetical protein
METLLSIFKFIGANWDGLLGTITAIFVALIAFFQIIPGDQPEKTLYKIVEFIKKWSRK